MDSHFHPYCHGQKGAQLLESAWVIFILISALILPLFETTRLFLQQRALTRASDEILRQIVTPRGNIRNITGSARRPLYDWYRWQIEANGQQRADLVLKSVVQANAPSACLGSGIRCERRPAGILESSSRSSWQIRPELLQEIIQKELTAALGVSPSFACRQAGCVEYSLQIDPEGVARRAARLDLSLFWSGSGLFSWFGNANEPFRLRARREEPFSLQMTSGALLRIGQRSGEEKYE